MVNLGGGFWYLLGGRRGGGSDALAAPSRSRAEHGCWAPRHTHIESRLPLFPAGSCICKSKMKNKKKPRLRKSTKVFTLPHALDDNNIHVTAMLVTIAHTNILCIYIHVCICVKTGPFTVGLLTFACEAIGTSFICLKDVERRCERHRDSWCFA